MHQGLAGNALRTAAVDAMHPELDLATYVIPDLVSHLVLQDHVPSVRQTVEADVESLEPLAVTNAPEDMDSPKIFQKLVDCAQSSV
jgi:hypothetical protein